MIETQLIPTLDRSKRASKTVSARNCAHLGSLERSRAAAGRLATVPDRDVDPPSSPALGWRRRAAEAPATAILIGICLVAFALTLALVGSLSEDPAGALLHSLWSIDSDTGLVQLGALELSRVWLEQEWWRLLTAAFLHGSWLHLLLNLSALWSIGEWLEPAIGSLKTLAIFLIAALGGSLASLVWCEAPVVVGASGGILGLAGALLFTRLSPSPSLSSPNKQPARDLREVSAPSLAIMIALCLGLGLVVPMIAQAGHVGGLVAGVLAAAMMLKRGPVRVVAGVALLALFILGSFSGAAPSERSNYHLFLGYHFQSADFPDRALASFENALERNAEDPSLANAVAYNLSLAGRDLKRADELVDRALADQPANSDYLDTKGWIACRRGDSADGLQWLRRANKASEEASTEILEHLDTCANAAP